MSPPEPVRFDPHLGREVPARRPVSDVEPVSAERAREVVAEWLSRAHVYMSDEQAQVDGLISALQAEGLLREDEDG